MEFLSIPEVAQKWNLSERTVRNYCATGKIPGAIQERKSWKIPANAVPPVRKNAKALVSLELLNRLQEEQYTHQKGGIYHRVQVDLTYNSNHIEGSTLTHDQTRYIFETKTIGMVEDAVRVNDIMETVNHFRCIDYIIENAMSPLTESMIKKLHFILKNGTLDSQKPWFAVGEYKKAPNEVGGQVTTAPEDVRREMKMLLREYYNLKRVSLESLLDFHARFERIHPFQDGNGRVGRLILFKECLSHGIVPFVIDERHKLYYYRGLKEWDNERGYLIGTCESAQDTFKEWLKYFRIPF